jgi:hypothetical protein
MYAPFNIKGHRSGSWTSLGSHRQDSLIGLRRAPTVRRASFNWISPCATAPRPRRQATWVLLSDNSYQKEAPAGNL